MCIIWIYKYTRSEVRTLDITITGPSSRIFGDFYILQLDRLRMQGLNGRLSATFYSKELHAELLSLLCISYK